MIITAIYSYLDGKSLKMKGDKDYLKTEIAKDIERADAMIQYDAQCKKVLSNKYVLAWIMQMVVEEYSDMPRDYIRQCIENEPDIGIICVEPGRDSKEESKEKNTKEENTKEKIEGLNTEDKDAVEGEITYDIRFAAFVPKETERMKIIVNVEAQQDFYPGYPIETRGIYYGARMISSQNGVEFCVPHYGDIKKVYSIWVCANAPQYIGNALTIYEMHKKDMVGNSPERKENYDKMAIVIIYLNSVVRREKGFFDMMNTLLSPTMDVNIKKHILWDEYQIPMERGFVKEVELMCNLSQWVLQTGIDQGVQQKERVFVENLLKEGFSDAMIMKVAEVTYEQINEIKEELNGMNICYSV